MSDNCAYVLSRWLTYVVVVEPKGDRPPPPSSPLQAAGPTPADPTSGTAGQQPRRPPGIVPQRLGAQVGQSNKCRVLYGCELHRGQFGVGCVSGVAHLFSFKGNIDLLSHRYF